MMSDETPTPDEPIDELEPTIPEPEPDPALLTVTCSTPGCLNEGAPIELWLYPDSTVICGPCGAEITPA